MGCLHLLVSEGAAGIAITQPEGLAALPCCQLTAFVSINKFGIFEQGLAGFADHLQQLSGCSAGANHHGQIPLRCRHSGKRGKGRLPAIAPSGGGEQGIELQFEDDA